MPHVPDPSTPEEADALRRRLLTALAATGLGDYVSPEAVEVDDAGITVALGLREARWFVNRLEDLAPVGSPAHESDRHEIAERERLRVVLEEVHTVPTGYEAARIIPRPTNTPTRA